MSIATDTFTAWLDVLVDTLDEPGLTGAEIAGRLHLSRFHLDRVISAAAGEAPTALRRRVMLERSAFRLATSRRSILDVGVEAGYGSHEAFTRAFRRAYGTTPRDWRAQPARIRIESVSDVHFHPPGGIRLPAQQKVTAMDLIQRMVEHHIWLTRQLIECARELTDAQLDEPIVLSVEDDPDPSTLRRIISRLVGQMQMWNASMASEEYDFAVEHGESLLSAQRRLDAAAPAFLENVRRAIENGELDDVFVDATCDPPFTCTYGAMVAHVLTFAAHRRTLAVLALDKHGVSRLGWGDPISYLDAPAR
ncbi:MAG: helix-turn-helix transcriptional regulator [Intrasporangium sp.]|uniref:helix-turn-helix transcriptional regulator n=1 Tax=Intrasporangium sp. TaxID=1925024 RepID=UPI00264A226B|nr:helix-turn-helix transcriptional regulator [Intrasporangium sp.]MDN5795150.1 helix-turn-helix transcriptional regulator [Intrasporangium sp.]